MMSEQKRKEVPLITFKQFQEHSDQIICVLSTRKGGVSKAPYNSLNLGFGVGDDEDKVLENYEIFAEALGITSKKIVYPLQNHTDQIAIIDDPAADFNHPIANTDALLTKLPGIYLAVRFADCQGVFVYDPVQKVVGAIHCGWRGNAQNILGKTIKKMEGTFGCNPEDILVGISPSLDPENAEFSDPYVELPEEMHPFIEGKKVNLWACSYEQLTAAGVVPGNIENLHRSTFEDEENFFSYRRSGGAEGSTGRMSGVIGLRS